MKYIFFTFLISQSLYAKEISQYSCKINKELKIELSLLDRKMPSATLINKKYKFGSCFFKTLPHSNGFDNKSITAEAIWHLKLEKCEYYSDKLKNKISLADTASFKQSPGKKPSFFHVLKDLQPLHCRPLR